MQMKMMARKLIANDQGGHLAAFQVTASQATAQQSLGALAVHVVATLISRSNLDPLCPMVTLLKAPGTLAVSLQFLCLRVSLPCSTGLITLAPHNMNLRICSTHNVFGYVSYTLINPRHASAARAMVLGLCVCLSIPTLHAMKRHQSDPVQQPLGKNAHFAKTMAFESEQLTLSLTMVRGPTHQLGCAHVYIRRICTQLKSPPYRG